MQKFLEVFKITCKNLGITIGIFRPYLTTEKSPMKRCRRGLANFSTLIKIGVSKPRQRDRLKFRRIKFMKKKAFVFAVSACAVLSLAACGSKARGTAETTKATAKVTASSEVLSEAEPSNSSLSESDSASSTENAVEQETVAETQGAITNMSSLEMAVGFTVNDVEFDDLSRRYFKTENGNLAEIYHTGEGLADGEGVYIRKAKVSGADISGDREEYSFSSEDKFGKSGVTLREYGDAEDQYNKVIWHIGGYSYSITLKGLSFSNSLLHSYLDDYIDREVEAVKTDTERDEEKRAAGESSSEEAARGEEGLSGNPIITTIGGEISEESKDTTSGTEN